MRPLLAVPAGNPADLTVALRAALDGSGPAILPLAPDAPRPLDLPDEVPVATAVVVATSGSSGTPKRVVLSTAALLTSAAATESALGGPGEWVLALPGHYIAGIQVIVRSLAAGGEPYAIPGGPFHAETFADAVAALPADRRRYSALVPTQLHRVLDAVAAGDRDVADAVRRLDALLIGGGPLADADAQRARDAGIRVVRTYGASETAGGCVYDGVPLQGVEVRVVEGEVQLAGPVLADGYLGDAARTERVFVSEPGRRWYRTGDAGDWDGERLTVTGRLDDVIVSGGEKVSLALVERAVQELPGMADAVVVRAPDPEWGEVPVVMTTAGGTDLPTMRAVLGERLGRAAAPSRIVVVDPLPLLSNGKPDRVRLTALAAEPT
ncbi:MAG TPA: AMP-binding protein [Amnibacterium sp.]